MYNSRNKVFDIRERSFEFGVRIVKLVNILPKTTAGYAIGNQVIRSGTAVGANIEEAQNAILNTKSNLAIVHFKL